ncbi:MAG: hypothetical protein E3J90_08990 [Promethearchaeota archaeon]|nr:MAG: hypothetical protein E3J90_08990 [Candidatus Lokiarchaeota archaeon]
MSFYAYKNRVEISLTKDHLKKMGKEMGLSIGDLQTILKNVLTATFESTIKDLNKWIDEYVPLIPDDYVQSNRESLQKKNTVNKTVGISVQDILKTLPEDANSSIHKEDIISSKLIETVEDSVPHIHEDCLRDHLKSGLGSCNLKDGRFYRIRLGFFLEPWIYLQLNNKKKLPSYRFFERFVEFAYTQTLHHLNENYEKFCPTEEIRSYLQSKIEVICKNKNKKITQLKKY